MDIMKSISTGNSLIKTCTCVIDAIYSSYDCIKFLSTLQRIESDLSLNYYKTVDSLKEDIKSKIPEISDTLMNSVETSNNQIPEEYSVLPIYSSIKLKKESKMYTLNIKKHHQLHSSIYEAIENSTYGLHRLYLSDKNMIEEIRDSISSILCLFFNTETQPDPDDSNVCCVKAKVAAVHVLGEFHPIENDELDGWIKVKIAHINTINSKLPAKSARRFLEKHEQIPRKLILKTQTSKESAAYNELVRQFMFNVMQTHSEPFESSNSLPTIKNMLESNTTNNNTQSSDLESAAPSSSTLPNLYQTASKVLNLITTTTNNNTNHDNQVSDVAKSESPEPIFTNFWRKLEKFCYENNATMVHKSKYEFAFKRNINASGFFKHVYFTKDNNVLQIFQRSTASQRIIEIASLLALKDKPYIGRIKEVIYDDDEVIGLTMDRYDMTLKDYLHKHTHQRLNAQERMDIVIQMLESINVSHQAGIAHRDLSTVNFMINSDAKLYLIDYGKAVFINARDAKRWWVESEDSEFYKEDVKAATREELAVWCRNLPYVMARPDHGYRFYRSIQTLPRSERDRNLLPHLIDPAAEDIYSLGTMIWKIFSGLEPWPGVFDTDLKKLREIVNNDFSIDRMLDRSMPGPISKMFLQMFLRVRPQDRLTAADILYWIKQDNIKDALLDEWSANNGSRRTAARNNIHCRAVTPDPSRAKAQKPGESSVTTISKDKEPGKRGRPRKTPKPDIDAEVIKRPIGRPRKSENCPAEESGSASVVHGSPLKHHTYVIGTDGIKRFAKSGIIVGRTPRNDNNNAHLTQVKKEDHAIKKRGRPRTAIIKREATESLSLQAAVAPTKKPNPPYKYVPTGKPRGRPRKYPRASSQEASIDETLKDATASNTNSVVEKIKASQMSSESTSSTCILNTNSHEASRDQATKTQDAGSSNSNSADYKQSITKSATSLSPSEKVQINPTNLTSTIALDEADNIDNSFRSSSSSNYTITHTNMHRAPKRSADDDIAIDDRMSKHRNTLKDNNATVSKIGSNELSVRIKLPITPNVVADSSNSKEHSTKNSSDINNTMPNATTESKSSKKHTKDITVTTPKEPSLLIKLPSQPQKILDKETMELISRSSLTNIRDNNRSMKHSPSASPKPSTSIVRSYFKQDLSPPSPQSPALSPVSNTETVEDIASPVSPVPGKRKYESDHEEKQNKRRNTNVNDTAQPLTADNFDLALFNILQNLDAHNNVH